jgi:O-acetylserine/cysteine efflux transporter
MLSKYPAADVTPFALLIPVSGLLGGIILVNESISTLAQIGIFVIMAGLGISVIGGRFSRKAKPT